MGLRGGGRSRNTTSKLGVKVDRVEVGSSSGLVGGRIVMEKQVFAFLL